MGWCTRLEKFFPKLILLHILMTGLDGDGENDSYLVALCRERSLKCSPKILFTYFITFFVAVLLVVRTSCGGNRISNH